MSRLDTTLELFGYGSLIFAPELEEAVVDRIPARLEGYARSFNKRSRSRGCRIEESFNRFPGRYPDFVVGNLNHSLVLGTEAVPQGEGAADSIEGVVLVYEPAARDDVLRLTDRREDYAPDRASSLNGYLRERIEVTCLRTGHRRPVLTYLTNSAPSAAWAAPPELGVADRARVLINATPRRPRLDAREREARGLHYLESVRSALAGIGIVDEALENLADAIRGLDGPWVERIAPRR